MTADTMKVKLTMNAGRQCVASNVRSIPLQLLEIQVPMVVGASVCYLLGRLIPASSGYASAYHPGTSLYSAGDLVFLTAPVVAWMLIRGRGWRHSLETAAAMLVPVAAIIVLGQLAAYPYLPLLVIADYPAMCLGLLVYMLLRPGDYAHSAMGHDSSST